MHNSNYRFTDDEAIQLRQMALSNPSLSAYDLWHEFDVKGRALNIQRLVSGATFTHLDTPPISIPLTHISLLNTIGERHGFHTVLSISKEEGVQLQCLECNNIEVIPFNTYKRMHVNGIALPCTYCEYLQTNFVTTHTFQEWREGIKRGTLPCIVCGWNMAIEGSELCRVCNTLNMVLERSFDTTLQEYISELQYKNDEE